MKIQEVLRNGTETPETLTATLGIGVKRHPEFPELVHFCYDQLESPKAHPIVKECRGLILNEADNWSVVCSPFFRFANFGEEWGDTIDWGNARVQEKIDGSLLLMWFYKGAWRVSTKGSTNAGGPVAEFDFNFAELFNKTFAKQIAPLNFPWKENWTIMWELTSPYNRIVCDHTEPKLTLIGVRDNVTMQEFPVATFTGLPVVKEFPLLTVTDVITAAEALNPMHQEGFVVVDGNFNRVKIKSPSYVLIHHLKDGFGVRRMIDLIKIGEQSEVLAYFPEYQVRYKEIEAGIDVLVEELTKVYETIKDIPIQKDFALEAVKHKLSGVLFGVRNGRMKSIRQGVLSIQTEKLQDILGLKESILIDL